MIRVCSRARKKSWKQITEYDKNTDRRLTDILVQSSDQWHLT